MANPAQNVEKLKKDLETCDFVVKKLGERYRVTREGHDGTAYLPVRLSDRHLKEQINLLASRVGFDPEEAERIRDQWSKERFAESLRVQTAAAERAANIRRAEQAARQQEEEATKAASHREETTIATTKIAAKTVTPKAVTPKAPAKRTGRAVKAATPAVEQAARPVSLFEKLYAEAQVIGTGPERVVFTEIDGVQAAELLGLNNFWDPKTEPAPDVPHTNRPYSPLTVNQYAEDMVPSDGSPSRWRKTVQALMFNRSKILDDGQQRLLGLQAAALRKSDYTMPAYIWFDTDPEAFFNLDLGRPRTALDFLGIGRTADRNAVNATANLIIRYHTEGGPDWRRKISPVQLLEFLRDNPQIHESVKVGRSVTAGIDIVPSALAAGHFLAAEAMPDRQSGLTDRLPDLTTDPLDLYFEGLRTGVGMTSDDPRLALHNWARRAAKPNERGKYTNVDKLARVIKMYNYFLGGKSAQFPKFDPKADRFPRPLEVWDPGTKVAFAYRHGLVPKQ